MQELHPYTLGFLKSVAPWIHFKIFLNQKVINISFIIYLTSLQFSCHFSPYIYLFIIW